MSSLHIDPDTEDVVSRRKFLSGLAAGTLAGAASLAVPAPLFALSSIDLPTPLQQTKGEWALTFREDFSNRRQFDKAWERVRIGGDGHKTMRFPKNVELANGELNLRLGHQSDPERPFTGGYIRTRDFRQTYGYFECEMRIAREAGVNNAFWLVSDRRTEGNTHFELDVAEVKYPNIVQVTARRWRPQKDVLAASYRAHVRLDDAFHRYAMLWTSNRFRFYVDDLEVFDAPNEFAHTPALVLLSNAVAPFAGKNDGDVVGAATAVRSVRVFRDFQQ
ncbi:glycoside hydrolase family 16 protein [uncultured Roseibium sp.]|uniref:glycoside hydrolase family 16 protein n=1 Tax=uncultured Roseibium sp. TaxID=1936171 RepID=UPI002625F3FD|nr:glycoside hydrolase family 16 protein [uncultured Roseibium sp.]